jgi:hypothetical protein
MPARAVQDAHEMPLSDRDGQIRLNLIEVQMLEQLETR